MSGPVIVVDIADVKAATEPARLVSIGLGSCVGVALFDSSCKVGSLAHIMLPTSRGYEPVDNRAKYADTAIPMALEEMEKLGASRSRIVAKIAGGAKMFSFIPKDDYIGRKNVLAVKQALKKEDIEIVAEDTGGNVGRTVEFDTSSGTLLVKTARRGVKRL
ncbi:MAG: chemotaxis protein CheD [Euryarchaeota archaeon]|nr:chemotaxis protein CheD [Euryarchaeota archaeon]